MPPVDWEKWIPIVENNRKTLERMEKKIDDIHDVVYKNGLSNKVSTLWEWRTDINKIILGIVTAILIAIIGYFIASPWDKDTKQGYDIERRLDKIERMLNENQNQN